MRLQPLIVMAVETKGPSKLENHGFEVVYCGAGNVNAAYNLTLRLCKPTSSRRFSYVLNLGTAGSDRFKQGTLVAAHQFVQRDMDVVGPGSSFGEAPSEGESLIITFPKRFVDLPHGICGSGKSFPQAVPINCDMVDMEAYALATVCMRQAIPFSCVKYITTGSTGYVSSDGDNDLKHATNLFADLLTSYRGEQEALTRDTLLLLIHSSLKRDNMSIAALERLSGVPKDAVRDFLRGKTHIPRADKLQKIMNVIQPHVKLF
ncbi:MAG: hypothetical protein WBY44_29760 [Bryobacteraceae bacterium]